MMTPRVEIWVSVSLLVLGCLVKSETQYSSFEIEDDRFECFSNGKSVKCFEIGGNEPLVPKGISRNNRLLQSIRGKTEKPSSDVEHENEDFIEKYQTKDVFMNSFSFAKNLRSIRNRFKEFSPFFLPKRESYEDSLDTSWTTDSYSESSDCQRDVEDLYRAFVVYEDEPSTRESVLPASWGLNIYDSWGKAEDGYFLGNTRYFGLLNQCFQVDSDNLVNSTTRARITGQYCTVEPTYIHNNRSKEKDSLPTLYGTCIPASCSAEDLYDGIIGHLDDYYYTVKEIHCQTTEDTVDWDTWAIVGTCLVLLMTLPVVIVTVIDLTFEVKLPPFLLPFSAARNLDKLAAVYEPDRISSLYGIRVLSACWVILGNYYLALLDSSCNQNEIDKKSDRWYLQVVWSAQRAADTFFFISGLLVTKKLLTTNFCLPKNTENSDQFWMKKEEEEVDNEEGVVKSEGIDYVIDRKMCEEVKSADSAEMAKRCLKNYALYIATRLIRFLPSIFFVIMMTNGFSKVFVRGPLKPKYQDYLEPCRNNWWYDLTLFSNVISAAKSNECTAAEDCQEANSCIDQGWYIGVDFQLYLVAPLLILPVKLLKRKIPYVLCLIFIGCLIPGLHIVVNEFVAANFVNAELADLDAFHYGIYTMAYARAAPYLVGSLCALLIMSAEREKNNSPKSRWLKAVSSKSIRVLGWAIQCALSLCLIFALVSINNTLTPEEETHMGGFVDFLYGGFVYGAWALCVLWPVLMCHLGYGGPVDTFLSHAMWQPLSRLTFVAFLIHVHVINVLMYSQSASWYFSVFSLMSTWCGVLTVTFIAAVPISLVAEAPYRNLLKGCEKETKL